jgi:hypothetical protein
MDWKETEIQIKMNIIIRNINESDFEQLLGLFKEFAVFERLTDKMTNSVEKMILLLHMDGKIAVSGRLIHTARIPGSGNWVGFDS